MESIPQKTCTRCQVTKPIDEFVKGPRYRDGYQPWCSVCRREYREQYKGNPSNVARIQERGKRWYEQNKERHHATTNRRSRWRWHNDPEYRKRKNAWKNEHYHSDPVFRAKRDERDKRYYQRTYNLPHVRRLRLVRDRFYAHRRRAWIRNSPGQFTQAEFAALCERYGNRCLACGASGYLSPDHVVPLARGGSNDISNIQPLCVDCNKRKNAKTIDYRPNNDDSDRYAVGE